MAVNGQEEPRGGKTSDRVAGALLIVMALLIGLESRTFIVGFVTDPLGPKAFPLVSALLLLVGGVVLQIRPGAESGLAPPKQLLRVAAATICLFSYALLLGFLGFFTTTLLVATVFALLLGGRPLPSIISAAGVSALLYAVFSYLLGIALPLGSLFLRSA
jgi:putative tricarboxylic transport membrane protein